MPAKSKGIHEEQVRPAGEPFVWLTSLGLSIGLLMVAGLLAVVVVNGIVVFWPKRVAQVTIKPGNSFKFMGSRTFAGELVKNQKKVAQKAGIEGGGAREWQLYVANKDVYGATFVFVDRDAIDAVDYPPGILRMERYGYGNAIGYPVALTNATTGRLDASDPSFNSKLAALNTEDNARRKEIERIEKTEIGRINARMQQLQYRKKEVGAGDQAALAAIAKETATLQTRYDTLAKQAAALRAKQSDYTLVYKLATGGEKSISAGDLASYYYPNQLGTSERLAWFFRNGWNFLAEDPREANTEGGVFPAIFGTFVMTLLMSVAVAPFGVLAAIYLREYASQGFFVRTVRIAVNNLAGVPSIVFGVFGLGFFVYLVGGTIDKLFYREALPTPTFGTGGVLWAALTLALMTVPVVIVATEEAISAVPRGMREASLACGASKWQTIQRVVLPSAVPGILTGLILAMARGAGEVAPLMLVGVVKLAPSLPVDSIWPYFHLERKFMHLGFHIYDLGFQSPDSEAAKPMVFATTFLLIVLVMVLNLGAIILREKIRRRYKLSTF